MYEDKGHRPHARHIGLPKNEILSAPFHLTVTLDTWGPVDNLFPTLYDKLQSNWGDAPSRTVSIQDWSEPNDPLGRYTGTAWAVRTGWEKLTEQQREYVESCFAGKTLNQVLENITFSFLIDGATRAATHQIVRTRVGAAYMQHGGRDNDWRHRPWVMPETIRRACEAYDINRQQPPSTLSNGQLQHPITDWDVIRRFLGVTHASSRDYKMPTLRRAIEMYLQEGRELYAALVDAGIPWEDARRLLWIGTSTYIHADYNYLALQGVMAKRLEHVMDWEINCIMQLMKREITMKCPPVFAKYLVSMSDRLGKAALAGLESWPPDGKYPNPYERCGRVLKDGDEAWVCNEPQSAPIHSDVQSGEYVGARMGYHRYQPVDTLPREHRPEQNPFWVLHPDSMAGGPIQWIQTNGTYPHEVVNGTSQR